MVGTKSRARRGPGSNQPNRKKTNAEDSDAGACEVATVISISTSIVAAYTYYLLILENSDTALGAAIGLEKTYLTRLTAGVFVILTLLHFIRYMCKLYHAFDCVKVT
ncbi:hypothetical protein [Candidatus Ichthyocystis sparus]|uniref:hypothetical protein n=1 Tax=Candidatus Ichthyocystis sparus TaxID=1561004 RepID=UPI000B84627A|nr:hypothetical protein [Candidatus Ichthyocystis sparus]